MEQLILIEGLPGTGKTSISKWMYGYLQKHEKNVTLLLEGDERIPLDFYEMTGIPKKDFQKLCLYNPNISKTLMNNFIQTENYVFVRIDMCPEDIANQIKCWDMGDENNQKISGADYIPCTLERLSNWIKTQIGGSGITIIESGFLQNPINELLFRRATDNEVRAFISDIANFMKPLNPICIYLQRKSADEAISFAKTVKGREWADRIDSLLSENKCEDLFQRRFTLEIELLPTIHHMICKPNGNDWSDVKKQIKNYFA